MFSTLFILPFAFLLSLPLLFLLAPHFLPPNNQIPIPAAEEIDDQALFARAVQSKSSFTRLSLDSKTKPKIAFLFLTNSDLHFAPPLWQRVPLYSFHYVYRSLFASSTFDKSQPATESCAELTRMGVKVRYKSFIEILSKSTSLWKRYPARGRYTMMPKVRFDQFQLWPHRTGTPTTVGVGVVVSDPDTGLRKVIGFG